MEWKIKFGKKGEINNVTAGLEDQDKVLKRLLRNQQDLGNAIKPYYGEKAGNKLAQLLTEHILIAGKVVEAAKTGNQANLKKFLFHNRRIHFDQ